MNELNDEELKRTYRNWYRNYIFADSDREILGFLDEQLKPYKIGQPGWLSKSRQALFLSGTTVADRLGMSRSAYAQSEKKEESGTITLGSLAKMAEAMDCELVYAIRPKNKKIFSTGIWQKLFVAASKHPWLKKCDQRKRGEALAGIMNRLMADPKFRREQGWSQRANQPN